MTDILTHERTLDWSFAARPIAGQTVSGDLHLVKPFARGMLLAAVDGVGHGDEATKAARMAVAVLEQHADESVIALVGRCHKALLKSRGVVMTLASLDALEDTITWLGIGNVTGRLFRAGRQVNHPFESVLLRGGIVGYQLPPLQAMVLPVTPGDLLILATDGISDIAVEDVNLNHPPQRIADRILERQFKQTDDALVLVARYLRMRHE
jgi:serine/threonine protein phosphatase PrpC